MDSKRELALKLVREGKTRVYFITGVDSPNKKAFIEGFLEAITHLEYAGKVAFPSARMVYATDKEYQPAYVLAFMGAERLSGYDIDRFVMFVRKHVDSGRVVIIPIQSVQVLSDKLGEDFVSYLSHLAVNIDLSVPRREIPTI